MRDTNFHEGDLVRIRAWDDMAEEYGLNNAGNIQCKLTFTTGMKPLCLREGKFYKIDGAHVVFMPESERNMRFTTRLWNISVDMIEKVGQIEDREIPDDALSESSVMFYNMLQKRGLIEDTF